MIKNQDEQNNDTFYKFHENILTKSLKSVDIVTKEQKNAHKERTDSCAVPAASIIAESMLCYVLVDNLLEKFEKKQIENLTAKKRIPAFRPGDTIKVTLKITEGDKSRLQSFEGM